MALYFYHALCNMSTTTRNYGFTAHIRQNYDCYVFCTSSIRDDTAQPSHLRSCISTSVTPPTSSSTVPADNAHATPIAFPLSRLALTGPRAVFMLLVQTLRLIPYATPLSEHYPTLSSLLYAPHGIFELLLFLSTRLHDFITHTVPHPQTPTIPTSRLTM